LSWLVLLIVLVLLVLPLLHPQFAVLDECTSAVSIDVEKKLYEAAKTHGVTSITISQRLALEEFHTHELQLGDSVSDAGWKLRPIHQQPSRPSSPLQ
jgi:ABC-type uncharacterized transport system fused permease/ATPase subunit